MKSAPVGRMTRASLLAGLVLVGTLLSAGVASAQAPDPRQPVDLAVAGPEDVPLGNLARVTAQLRDRSGQPLAGARIAFSTPAAFAGAVGEMALGEVLTDAAGVATLDHQLRIQGRNQIIARFYGDETHQPAQASVVVLATGQAQLTQRTAGIQVPVLGAWTLVLVLGGVWSVYFIALLMVAGIPEPDQPQPAPESGGRP